ncbi:hypothetical protein DFQ28_008722 [Apophysomyces sp. BC1034]|nr:hypothetical protein DFQ30_008534 [Apophysomyces sp. BC1015]KAG0185830.1 hypothetical protein DFQ28_008722 [Apophysomyces sp. BC1034]
MSQPTTIATSRPRSRLIYIVAIAVLILLWVLVWSRQDGSQLILPGLKNQLQDEIAVLPLPANTTSLCTPDTFNNGQWRYKSVELSSRTPDAFEQAVGYHCPWGFAHKCYQRLEEGREFERSKKIIEYRWEPSSCTLAPMDERALARHLKDHPLLLIGDSITQLQFESLWCFLGLDLTNPKRDTNLTGGRPNMWVSQLVHSDLVDTDSVTLAYLRSDYLVRLDDFKIMEPLDEEGYLIGKGNNFPWAQALSRFDYIMINTGPHWHPDLKWGPHRSREELLAAYTKAMDVVFRYLKQHVQPHQRVWVRSTPYGHAKCSKFKTPQKYPQPPTGKPGEYEWDMLEKFDEVWKAQ